MTIDIKSLLSEFIVPDNEREFYAELGQVIKNVRCNRNLSQMQIAEMLGTTVEFVDAYEQGILAIPIYQFFTLATKLGYPVEFDEMTRKL